MLHSIFICNSLNLFYLYKIPSSKAGYHLIDEIVKGTLLIQQELHKIQNISGLKLHIFRLKLMEGITSHSDKSSCLPRIFRKGI